MTSSPAGALSGTALRVATAAVLIPVVLAVVLWAPQWLYAAFVGLFALLALHEYLAMAQKWGAAPFDPVAYLSAAALIAWPSAAVSVLLLTALGALALTMLPRRPLESALPAAAATLLGVAYVGLPMALLADLRRLPQGALWVIYVLLITWISDTAAYFAGRAFGKRKLAPRISSGKTWEGAVASTVAAAVFGAGFAAWRFPDVPLLASLAMAIAVNLAGQVGDLAESALKRGTGVKDSSALLPGHGGLLDRIDALLFAAPVLWYYAFFASI